MADAENEESRSLLAGHWSESGAGAVGTGEGPSQHSGQEVGASS